MLTNTRCIRGKAVLGVDSDEDALVLGLFSSLLVHRHIGWFYFHLDTRDAVFVWHVVLALVQSTGL